MLSITFMYAAGSAITRSALNLIDRHLYATRRRSIYTTMVVNLVLPLAGCAVAVLATGAPASVGTALLSVDTLIPAAMIQIVSYAYATAFRCSPVASVAVDSKLGEVLVPIALTPWTGIWRPADYAFYALSFAAFLPMMWRRGRLLARLSSRSTRFVVGATVLQAIVFSIAPPGARFSSVDESIVFHTCVLAWRVLISVGVMVALVRPQPEMQFEPMRWIDGPILLLRGGCFLLTQVTFLLALRQPESHLAWPILNATSLLSAMTAAPLLKEKPSKDEVVALVLLTAVTIARVL